MFSCILLLSSNFLDILIAPIKGRKKISLQQKKEYLDNSYNKRFLNCI